MTGQAVAHVEKLRGLAGLTRCEAAEQLGLCESYVVRLAKDAGIPLQKNKRRGEARVEQLRELAASGFTRKEAAKELSMSAGWVNQMAGRHGIKFLHGRLILVPPLRVQQMAALYRSGKILHDIGCQYGLTRERIRQLLSKFYGINALDGGKHKTGKDRRAVFEAKRNAQSLKRWGCNWDQYVVLRDMRKPTRCFRAQRQNAAKRGLGWELNLWQWWSIWQQSGKWAQRGRGNGFMMCRINDVGPYAVGNVYIANGCENSSREHAKTSGLPRGVSLNRSGWYYAKRCIAGKTIYLGAHPTPQLAHAAYLAAGAAQ